MSESLFAVKKTTQKEKKRQTVCFLWLSAEEAQTPASACVFINLCVTTKTEEAVVFMPAVQMLSRPAAWPHVYEHYISPGVSCPVITKDDTDAARSIPDGAADTVHRVH